MTNNLWSADNIITVQMFDHFSDELNLKRHKHLLSIIATVFLFAAIPATAYLALNARDLSVPAASPPIGGGNTYADCSLAGCVGPSLTTNWPRVFYRLRYQVFGAYSDWQTTSSTSFTAPHLVGQYEVQIAIGNQFYPWKTGTLNNTSSRFSWATTTYRARLLHDTESVDGCYRGVGNSGGKINNCVDFRTTTGSSAVFTGLSPNEYYDLTVRVRINQNVGTEVIHIMRDHIGPTGACNCPTQPPPPPPPPPSAGYIDCSATNSSECSGTSLTADWSDVRYRVRFKCCLVPQFGNWVEVGSSISYTAQFPVFEYEVEFLGLSSDYVFATWYPYASGTRGGSTKVISWQKATYQAKLTHDTDLVNGCISGTGVLINNCNDTYRGANSSANFTGLSPKEKYSLYVTINNRTLTVQKGLGPTGDCNCVVLPPPPMVNLDTDLDGFTDQLETYVGTDPALSCGVNAWPSDLNNNKSINVADLSLVAQKKGTDEKRYDFNQDGLVTDTDINIVASYMSKTCS